MVYGGAGWRSMFFIDWCDGFVGMHVCQHKKLYNLNTSILFYVHYMSMKIIKNIFNKYKEMLSS